MGLEPATDRFRVTRLGCRGRGNATRNESLSGGASRKSGDGRLGDRGHLGHVLGDLPAAVDLGLVDLAGVAGEPPRPHRLEDGRVATVARRRRTVVRQAGVPGVGREGRGGGLDGRLGGELRSGLLDLLGSHLGGRPGGLGLRPAVLPARATETERVGRVDLDVVRQKQSSGGWFDPTSYLTGKLPVTATGKIVTGDGKGRFELERAEVSGVQIPKSFLAQMVNFFTRTADNPKGSSIDDVFVLPAGIQRIDVAANRWTVHQ